MLGGRVEGWRVEGWRVNGEGKSCLGMVLKGPRHAMWPAGLRPSPALCGFYREDKSVMEERPGLNYIAAA